METIQIKLDDPIIVKLREYTKLQATAKANAASKQTNDAVHAKMRDLRYTLGLLACDWVAGVNTLVYNLKKFKNFKNIFSGSIYWWTETKRYYRFLSGMTAEARKRADKLPVYIANAIEKTPKAKQSELMVLHAKEEYTNEAFLEYVRKYQKKRGYKQRTKKQEAVKVAPKKQVVNYKTRLLDEINSCAIEHNSLSQQIQALISERNTVGIQIQTLRRVLGDDFDASVFDDPDSVSEYTASVNTLPIQEDPTAVMDGVDENHLLTVVQ